MPAGRGDESRAGNHAEQDRCRGPTPPPASVRRALLQHGDQLKAAALLMKNGFTTGTTLHVDGGDRLGAP